MAKMHKVAALALVTALTLSACGGGDGGKTSATTTAGDPTKISGEITVLTNRTDIASTVMVDYAKKFNEKYPDVKVKFESHTDYDGEVTIRMGTEDYGDVFLIPNNTITVDQFSQYAEPLGTVDELKGTYKFVQTEGNYEDTVYGIAVVGNVSGYVVNTKLMADAGITAPPTTPAEFLAALKSVKDTSGATYYTNYFAGWPLAQWQANEGVVAGPDAKSIRDSQDAPWSEGNEQHAIDGLLYDIVKEGLNEADPTTTDWDQSKIAIGKGEVSSMVLGSWALSQVKQAASDNNANPDDLSFWPLPFTTDGKLHSVASGDYKIGVNKHSKNKEAAKAWLFWFLDESGYAYDNGGISPRIDDTRLPDALADFDKAGVEVIQLNPTPEGEEGLDDKIRKEAEIDIWGQGFRQEMIDVARGAKKGDKESFFAGLNERWAKARAEILG